jgi:YVTN family beta-propeller protein
MNHSLLAMQRIALFILILGIHIVHCSPFVYVANHGSNNVSVIDAATNGVIKTIDLGSNQPAQGGQIAITPDGKTVYVPCYDGTTGTVQRIDVASNTLLTPITIGSGEIPNSIAITPNGLYGYVTYNVGGYGFVARINIAANAVDNTISGFATATLITITPNGLTAYVNVGSATFVPMNLMNDMPNFPGVVSNTLIFQTIASPDNHYLYVCERDSSGYPGAISQFNISNPLSPVLLQSISVPSLTPFAPFGLAITTDGNTLYFASGDTTPAIGAIDISNPASPVVDTIIQTASGTWPFAIALTPDQKSLYVTSYTTDQTFAFNVSSALNPTFNTAITVGTQPFGIVVAPSNSAPTNVSGCKTKNVFLFQTDYINKLTWSTPANGTPAAYNIYRDAALTDLAGTVSASDPLQFYDHNRNPSVIYSYYITSVDGSGNESDAASMTVTSSC